MTPFEFGHAVGSLEKSAVFPGVIGGTIGAAQAPSGSRLEGFGRGMARDIGTQLGAGVVGRIGHNYGAHIGRMFGPAGRLYGSLAGALGGAVLGGVGGYHGAGKIIGPASYQTPVAPATAMTTK